MSTPDQIAHLTARVEELEALTERQAQLIAALKASHADQQQVISQWGRSWPQVDRRKQQLADWTGLDRRQPMRGN